MSNQGETRFFLNLVLGLAYFFKFNVGCKGFIEWFDHISLLDSGLLTWISKSVENSPANIQCCSSLGKALLVDSLRLLYISKPTLGKCSIAGWQKLASRQDWISLRQTTNAWFQSEPTRVTWQGRWRDDQRTTAVCLINLRLCWQSAEAVRCERQRDLLSGVRGGHFQ